MNTLWMQPFAYHETICLVEEPVVMPPTQVAFEGSLPSSLAFINALAAVCDCSSRFQEVSRMTQDLLI